MLVKSILGLTSELHCYVHISQPTQLAVHITHNKRFRLVCALIRRISGAYAVIQPYRAAVWKQVFTFKFVSTCVHTMSWLPQQLSCYKGYSTCLADLVIPDLGLKLIGQDTLAQQQHQALLLPVTKAAASE